MSRAALTTRQTQVLSMYYFDGLSVRAIARTMGLYRTTVHQHKQYGERKLHHCGLSAERRIMDVSSRVTKMESTALDTLHPSMIRAIW